MLALFIQGCVFFFLVIMIEYKFFYHRKPTARPIKDVSQTEEDVLAEENAVMKGLYTFIPCLWCDCALYRCLYRISDMCMPWTVTRAYFVIILSPKKCGLVDVGVSNV